MTNVVFPAACENILGFGSCRNLTEITLLNKNVQVNASWGFKDATRLRVINYAGTLEEWNANESLVTRWGEGTDTEVENRATIGSGSSAITLNYNYTR